METYASDIIQNVYHIILSWYERAAWQLGRRKRLMINYLSKDRKIVICVCNVDRKGCDWWYAWITMIASNDLKLEQRNQNKSSFMKIERKLNGMN